MVNLGESLRIIKREDLASKGTKLQGNFPKYNWHVDISSRNKDNTRGWL